MLEATTMPVEQVAADVGYEDLAYFRRLFRRLTGMSPAGYRRKFRPPGYACIPVGDSRSPATAARVLAS